MAMTPGLIERMADRIASAMGMTQVEFQEYQKKYMSELDQRLEQQLKNQQMTPEILNKRCTL
jgi:uncharacterized protein YeaO (DUF488 family)